MLHTSIKKLWSWLKSLLVNTAHAKINPGMHLVLVKIIGSGETPHDPKRPELPSSLERPFGWTQASSLFQGEGKVLVFLPDATEQELTEIAAQEGAEIVEQIGTSEQGVNLINYTKEQAPEWDAYSSLQGEARMAFKAEQLGMLGAEEKKRAVERDATLKARKDSIDKHLEARRDNFLAAYRPAAERFERLRGKI